MFQTQLTNRWNIKIELKYEEQVVIQDLLDLQFFPGSLDRNSPETQLLGTPVSAQYVRILPLEVNGQAGLRFDVLGCTPDCKETNFLPVSQFSFQKLDLIISKICYNAALCSLNRCNHVRQCARLQLRQW